MNNNRSQPENSDNCTSENQEWQYQAIFSSLNPRLFQKGQTI
jgi:hypothetical protein